MKKIIKKGLLMGLGVSLLGITVGTTIVSCSNNVLYNTYMLKNVKGKILKNNDEKYLKITGEIILNVFNKALNKQTVEKLENYLQKENVLINISAQCISDEGDCFVKDFGSANKNIDELKKFVLGHDGFDNSELYGVKFTLLYELDQSMAEYYYIDKFIIKFNFNDLKLSDDTFEIKYDQLQDSINNINNNKKIENLYYNLSNIRSDLNSRNNAFDELKDRYDRLLKLNKNLKQEYDELKQKINNH